MSYEVRAYKIFWDDCDDTYVGATKATLAKRMAGHRIYCRKQVGEIPYELYRVMAEKGDRNFKYVLVATRMVSNSDEKRRFEQEWIDKLKPSLNMFRAHIEGEFSGTGVKKSRGEIGATKRGIIAKEWRRNFSDERKEIMLKSKRDYYQANCDVMKARVNEYRLNNLDDIKKKKAAHYKNTNEKAKRKEKRAVAKQEGLFKCDLCDRTYGSKFLKDRHDREQHGPDAAAVREARNAKLKERLEAIVTYNGVEMTRRDLKNLKRREKRAAAKHS